MTLDRFVSECKLTSLSETEKACYLAFYFFKKDGVLEFSAAECSRWFEDLHLPKPNTWRLTRNLRSSREKVNRTKPGFFRLHHNFLKMLESRYPQLSIKSQDVMDEGTILPPRLYEGTRGFIESLAKQINRSYEQNIFDGCAVLMRRLEEVLLITAYEHLNIKSEIQDANRNYLLLEGIVKNAVSNATLNLDRNSKRSIETFRELGNYSAHKVRYICKREYIEEKIDAYRALIEELLHKANLKR